MQAIDNIFDSFVIDKYLSFYVTNGCFHGFGRVILDKEGVP